MWRFNARGQLKTVWRLGKSEGYPPELEGEERMKVHFYDKTAAVFPENLHIRKSSLAYIVMSKGS